MMSIGKNSRSVRSTRTLVRTALPPTVLALALGLFATGQFGGCISGAPLNCDSGDVDCDDPTLTLPSKTGGKGGAGGAAAGVVTCEEDTLRAAVLENCADYADLPAFEMMFIAPRCGVGMDGKGACHRKTGNLFPPVLEGTDIFLKIAGKKNTNRLAPCPDDFYVNLTDASKSTILTKNVATDPVTDPPISFCPSDGTLEFGLQMPYNEATKLTDTELACLTSYVTLIATNCSVK